MTHIAPKSHLFFASTYFKILGFFNRELPNVNIINNNKMILKTIYFIYNFCTYFAFTYIHYNCIVLNFVNTRQIGMVNYTSRHCKLTYVHFLLFVTIYTLSLHLILQSLLMSAVVYDSQNILLDRDNDQFQQCFECTVTLLNYVNYVYVFFSTV